MPIRDLLRYAIITGVFAIPVLISVIVPSSMFFPYITGKNFAFRIIVELIFSLWVVLALLDARYRPRFSWLLAAILTWLAVIGVADVFGVNFFKSFWSNFERMEGYITLLHLVAYFVVAATVFNTDRLWNALWATTLGWSVIVVFIAMKPLFEALPDILSVPRLDGTFGNPIYLAIYSAFHFFIAAILFMRWRGGQWLRWLLGGVMLLHVLSVFYTQTRGTMIGLLGGILLAAIIIAIFERQQKLARGLAIGALATVALIVGSVFVLKDSEFAKTNPIVNRFTTYDLSGGTIQARFMNWGMAWEGIKDRPLLGYGQGNYGYVFSKYYNPRMYNEEPWFDRVHDIVFDWLVAGGFLGALAYFSIPAMLLLYLWYLRRKELAMSVTERALWMGLLAAYFFHNLFVFDNIVSYILYFSVLAYLAWRITEHDEPLWQTRVVDADMVKTVVLPVMLVVMAALIYFANLPGIKSSQALIQALVPQASGPETNYEYFETALKYDMLGRIEVREQLVQRAVQVARAEGIDAELRQRFMTLAETEMARELARTLQSARLELFMASFERNRGQFDKALMHLERARELTPTKQVVYFQLGEIYLNQGNDDEALQMFKIAFELEPRYDEARKLYALTLIRTGHADDAQQLLENRWETVAVDDARLLNEWLRAERYDVAKMILEVRHDANPDDGQLVVSLAAAHVALGERETAIDLLREFGGTHPEYEDQISKFIADIRAGRTPGQAE